MLRQSAQAYHATHVDNTTHHTALLRGRLTQFQHCPSSWQRRQSSTMQRTDRMNGLPRRPSTMQHTSMMDGRAGRPPQCNAPAVQPTGGGELTCNAIPCNLAQPLRHRAPGLAIHPGLELVGGQPVNRLELEPSARLDGHLALELSNQATSLQRCHHKF